jgi:hypothetical protein
VKRYLLLLLSAGLFMSCAGSLPYSIDYPLTEQTFRSRDGVFACRVPQGWFTSSGDTIVPALVAWLMKDDLSATMGVKEIHLDQTASRRVERDGLELLATISAGLHQGDASSPSIAVPPKEFEMRGKKFCGYEIAGNGKRARIVVFSARSRYYECQAEPVNGAGSADEILKMFTAQQTFLASMTF